MVSLVYLSESFEEKDARLRQDDEENRYRRWKESYFWRVQDTLVHQVAPSETHRQVTSVAASVFPKQKATTPNMRCQTCVHFYT